MLPVFSSVNEKSFLWARKDKPLGKTLAMVSEDLGPMREHFDAHKKVHFHNCLATGEQGKTPSPSIGTVIRGPQR